MQSIMQYNGGSVIAMVGKDCVAIAADTRLGVQSLGISANFKRVRLYVVIYLRLGARSDDTFTRYFK